jgi:predicted anti-sigma-YlaC factor YlaD
MNCEAWRTEIVALVDGSCEPREIPKVERHLGVCPACRSFYREQLELSALLGAPELEATPPEHLWYRIESRLQPVRKEVGWAARWVGWLDLWRFPALRYAAVSALVLIVASLFFLNLGESARSDPRVLAQLEAYDLRVEGNPFLARLGEPRTPSNPFFTIEPTLHNPFQVKGNQQ